MKTFLENLVKADGVSLCKGVLLFNDNNVKIENVTEHNAVFNVFDDKTYEVSLSFNSSKKLINYLCSCGKDGICEHVVASIYELDKYKYESKDAFSQGLKTKASAFINQINAAYPRIVYEKLKKYYRELGDQKFCNFLSIILSEYINNQKNDKEKMKTFFCEFRSFTTYILGDEHATHVFEVFFDHFDFQKLIDKYIIDNFKIILNSAPLIEVNLTQGLFNHFVKNPNDIASAHPLLEVISKDNGLFIDCAKDNQIKTLLPIIKDFDFYEHLSGRIMNIFPSNLISEEDIQPFLSPIIDTLNIDYNDFYAIDFIERCVKHHKYKTITCILNGLIGIGAVFAILDKIDETPYCEELINSDKYDFLKDTYKIYLNSHSIDNFDNYKIPKDLDITSFILLIKGNYFNNEDRKMCDYNLDACIDDILQLIDLLYHYSQRKRIPTDILTQILNKQEINSVLHEEFYNNFYKIDSLISICDYVDGFNFIDLEVN